MRKALMRMVSSWVVDDQIVTIEVTSDLTAFLKERRYGIRSRIEASVSLIVESSDKLANKCWRETV